MFPSMRPEKHNVELDMEVFKHGLSMTLENRWYPIGEVDLRIYGFPPRFPYYWAKLQSAGFTMIETEDRPQGADYKIKSDLKMLLLTGGAKGEAMRIALGTCNAGFLPFLVSASEMGCEILVIGRSTENDMALVLQTYFWSDWSVIIRSKGLGAPCFPPNPPVDLLPSYTPMSLGEWKVITQSVLPETIINLTLCLDDQYMSLRCKNKESVDIFFSNWLIKHLSDSDTAEMDRIEKTIISFLKFGGHLFVRQSISSLKALESNITEGEVFRQVSGCVFHLVAVEYLGTYGVCLVLRKEHTFNDQEEEEEEEGERVEQARTDMNSSQEDIALIEMNISTAKEAHQLARDRKLESTEQLCELSRALAVLASASCVSTEREGFLRLVNKEIELYNSMVEKEVSHGDKDAFKAYKAAREEHAHENAADSDEGDKVSSALIERVDAMLQNLEKEIHDVDAKIGDRWRLLDRDYDGKVTPEEVASAAMYLKDTLGKEGIQGLVSSLSKDKDGKILVEDIVKLGGWKEDGNTAEEP